MNIPGMRLELLFCEELMSNLLTMVEKKKVNFLIRKKSWVVLSTCAKKKKKEY
jgi:hypothetical protein